MRKKCEQYKGNQKSIRERIRNPKGMTIRFMLLNRYLGQETAQRKVASHYHLIFQKIMINLLDNRDILLFLQLIVLGEYVLILYMMIKNLERVKHLTLKGFDLTLINSLINSNFFNFLCLIRGFYVVILAEIVELAQPTRERQINQFSFCNVTDDILSESLYLLALSNIFQHNF